MKKYIYGIDIGGTTVKIGLFDLQDKLIKKWEIDTRKGNNGKELFSDIVKSIKKETPDLSEVEGYGFGIPGPVSHNHVNVAVNLGLKDINIKDELKDALENEKIYTANDANVAALGEAINGAGKGQKDVVMLTLGTGVGGGIVVNDKVIEGSLGCAGEIGHLTVDPNSKIKCNCGKYGCLETVASATGVRNVYYQLKETYKGDSPLFKLQYPSAKAIIDAAKKGDDIAVKTMDYVSYYLGYACNIVALTTNPSTIVIGGGVSKAGDFLINHIKKHFEELSFKPTITTNIVQATLGNDAGMFGAKEMVKNNG